MEGVALADDHDIVIAGGTLIDGTGAPGARMEVCIDGDKVTALQPPGEMAGSLVLDASGCVVSPGFIDIHTHSDLSLISCPRAESKIRQGVTTEVVGNCGTSAAPAVGPARAVIQEIADSYEVTVDWSSLEEYFLRLAKSQISVNVASLVGAEIVRLAVLGSDDVKPSNEELVRMKELVTKGMRDGAYGLSSGLIYAPGCYASTEELVALAAEVAPFEGVYASHIRGEGRTLLSAVEEAITVGRKARVRVQISHHKAVGPRNWGLVKESLRVIEAARVEGVDVAVDVYPYKASCTNLYAVLPPWVQNGGRDAILKRLKEEDVRERIKREFKELNESWENTVAEDGWDNIEVSGFKNPANKSLEHKRLSEIADLRGELPDDVVLDLISEEGFDLMAVFHEIDADDVAYVISHPLASIASDGEVGAAGGPSGGTAVHPRAFGTFPRAIREYALDGSVVSLQEMIRKMTSMPAARIGIVDRGVLAPGMKADVTIFDPVTIRDTATYERPSQYAHGIVHVLVNGALTIENAEHTGMLEGRILRKPPPGSR